MKMGPILHGLDQTSNVTTVKVPTDKINLEGLLNTFESNLDKRLPEEWLTNYREISSIYKLLFTYGELPEDVLMNTDYTILEMAAENIESELEDVINAPGHTSGRDFYYEFARSIGVEKKAAMLKEAIDEDCDFV